MSLQYDYHAPKEFVLGPPEEDYSILARLTK